MQCFNRISYALDLVDTNSLQRDISKPGFKPRSFWPQSKPLWYHSTTQSKSADSFRTKNVSWRHFWVKQGIIYSQGLRFSVRVIKSPNESVTLSHTIKVRCTDRKNLSLSKWKPLVHFYSSDNGVENKRKSVVKVSFSYFAFSAAVKMLEWLSFISQWWSLSCPNLFLGTAIIILIDYYS